jgi:hypothetical protein
MKTTTAWMVELTTRFAGLLSSFTPPSPMMMSDSIIATVTAFSRRIPVLSGTPLNLPAKLTEHSEMKMRRPPSFHAVRVSGGPLNLSAGWGGDGRVQGIS